MKIRAEIKAQALRGFTSRYWPVVGINILGALIIAAMGYIPTVGWLLSLLVGTVIAVGLNGFFLNVYRGDQIKVENLFSPFNRYGRVLGGSLWMALWLFLWSLIFIVPFVAIFVVGIVNTVISSIDFSNLGSLGHVAPPDITPNQIFGMFLNPWWLLLYLLLIPAIIKSYSYFATRYILADSPNVGAIEALTLSQKMMHGFKWKLFVTQLSFILWFLPGIGAAVLFCLSINSLISAAASGYFWVFSIFNGFSTLTIALILILAQALLSIFYVGPYYNAAIAGFYNEVREQAKQKGIQGAELL